MQNLHLHEYSEVAFWSHVHHYQCLAITVELTAMGFVLRFQCIENHAHGTEKLLLNTWVSKDFA